MYDEIIIEPEPGSAQDLTEYWRQHENRKRTDFHNKAIAESRPRTKPAANLQTPPQGGTADITD
jgi:hypothetical protein